MTPGIRRTSFAGAGNPLPGVVFLDVEASGLGFGSYPIEVGWATCDLASEQRLVRPFERWEDEGEWSSESEAVHRIPRIDLLRHGCDPVETADVLNAALAGRRVLSDAVRHDQAWLGRLFREAGVRQAFALEDAEELVLGVLWRRLMGRGRVLARYREIEREAWRHFPHTHRAGDDALGWAAAARLAAGAALPPGAPDVRYGA